MAYFLQLPQLRLPKGFRNCWRCSFTGHIPFLVTSHWCQSTLHIYSNEFLMAECYVCHFVKWCWWQITVCMCWCWNSTWGIFLPQIIKIGQCLTKLRLWDIFWDMVYLWTDVCDKLLCVCVLMQKFRMMRATLKHPTTSLSSGWLATRCCFCSLC